MDSDEKAVCHPAGRFFGWNMVWILVDNLYFLGYIYVNFKYISFLSYGSNWVINSMGTRTRCDESDIEELSLTVPLESTPGITHAFGEFICEAASVCLENQNHSQGTKLIVDGDFNEAFYLKWNNVTSQTRRCWADLQEATEYGAYGIAILLVPKLTEFTIVERSRKGTGFDFWLGPKENPEPLFQKNARLEVSGILNGTETRIRLRTKEKLDQIQPSEIKLPALVIVIEFSEPRSRVVKK